VFEVALEKKVKAIQKANLLSGKSVCKDDLGNQLSLERVSHNRQKDDLMLLKKNVCVTLPLLSIFLLKQPIIDDMK